MQSKDGWTALHQAAINGHEAVVRLLLDNGANIEAKSSLGQGLAPMMTPLHCAAEMGHGGVLKLLLQRGQYQSGGCGWRIHM